jgi:penicillin amidase
VSGARSATGSPLLATDPHRPLDHPSARYLVHLNAPGWNVIGAAAPWLPGVVIGHNARVAWAMTNREADVQDLRRARQSRQPSPDRRSRSWADTVVVADPIVFVRPETVRVRPRVPVTVRSSRPIVSGT